MMGDMGCKADEDLVSRIFLTMVYPPGEDDQSGARMLAVERNTVTFSEFIDGLALFFEPGRRHKREKAIYNFYDFNRQGAGTSPSR